MSVDIPIRARTRPVTVAAWKSAVAEYQQPSVNRAVWQLVNSIGGFVLAWALMYVTVDVSWWLTVPLAVIAGGLMVRIFIIFHDCGHGSFLRSKRANSVIGFICGALTFTPYARWSWEHARHHARSGNLDHRGTGDIWTMTVREYLDASRWQRFGYRLARNPFSMLLVGPFFLMLVKERLPCDSGTARERRSVWWMNAAVLTLVIGLGSLFGWVDYLILQLIVIWVAGASGVWLFYIQHQYEDVYWERGAGWNYTDAALEGSSFYRLPRVLQWFSGNIGYHHIHHLCPRIPNYHLQRCHESNPLFRAVPAITLRSSLKSLSLRLWDEASRQLVGFGHLKTLRQESPG